MSLFRRKGCLPTSTAIILALGSNSAMLVLNVAVILEARSVVQCSKGKTQAAGFPAATIGSRPQHSPFLPGFQSGHLVSHRPPTTQYFWSPLPGPCNTSREHGCRGYDELNAPFSPAKPSPIPGLQEIAAKG